MGRQSVRTNQRSSFAIIFHIFLYCHYGIHQKGGVDIVVLFVVLLVAALTDLLYEKVPNLLILGGILLGVAYRLLMGSFASGEMLLGMAVPVFLFWPLFVLHAMGAGDIKLMSVIGLFLGWKSMLLAVGCAILLAGAAGLFKSLRDGILWKRFGYLIRYLKQVFLYCSVGGGEFPAYQNGEEASGSKVHFAVALLAGSLVVTGGFL